MRRVKAKGLTGIHARLRTKLTAYRARGPVCSWKPPCDHTTKDARPMNTYRNDLRQESYTSLINIASLGAAAC